MSTQETEIHVRLLTGELSGIRIADFRRDDLQAILIPRRRLCDAKQHTDRRLAVYLLLETAGATGYIGQTDDAWRRLNYWNNKEDWWKTAIALTSKTEHGLNLDDIHWLEWRCITAAKEIERQRQATKDARGFQFPKNKQQPNEPSIANAMQGAMCGLFDSLCTLASVLGYPVFEPVEDIDRPSVQDEISVTDSGEVFHCRGKDADATGAFAEGGFIVRKGSLARPDTVPCAKETVEPIRQKLVDDGILNREGGKLRFAHDHTFRSVSGAASVVLGRPADGWIEWEDKNGKSLDEIRASQSR